MDRAVKRGMLLSDDPVWRAAYAAEYDRCKAKNWSDLTCINQASIYANQRVGAGQRRAVRLREPALPGLTIQEADTTVSSRG